MSAELRLTDGSLAELHDPDTGESLGVDELMAMVQLARATGALIGDEIDPADVVGIEYDDPKVEHGGPPDVRP